MSFFLFQEHGLRNRPRIFASTINVYWFPFPRFNGQQAYYSTRCRLYFAISFIIIPIYSFYYNSSFWCFSWSSFQISIHSKLLKVALHTIKHYFSNWPLQIYIKSLVHKKLILLHGQNFFIHYLQFLHFVYSFTANTLYFSMLRYKPKRKLVFNKK